MGRRRAIAAIKELRRNEQIRAQEVRLIDENGQQIGILPLEVALQRAREAGLDLVEIAPQAKPPVCRIMDYGKYRFEQSKKLHAARKKQKQVVVKEIKLRPATGEGDYQVKLKHMREFLEEGDKVKVTIRFRGREVVHKELGMEMLHRVRKDLEPLAVVEQEPKMEGRQMSMVLAPKKR